MHRLPFFIVSVFAVAACGYFERHGEVDGKGPLEELAAAHAGWLRELAAASDPATGWPSTEDCDATLWAGLAAAAGGPVHLEAAEHEPGVIHRRPARPCWTVADGDVGSRSTVSRDMLTGYLWGVWRAGALPAAVRLADYGQAHAWVMGLPESRPFEVELGQNLRGLLCRMIERLSHGGDARACRLEAAVYLPVGKDFEHHLQVLGIALGGEVDVGVPAASPGLRLLDVNGQMLARLKEAASDDPDDALFQAALGVYTGDYDRALALLGDPAYVCPSYVRGAPTYCLVHKAFAAALVLRHHPEASHASAE